MSATLLQENDKCNELKDNRESPLHILIWMASHFTNRTISGGSTNRFLRAFDEYEDEEDVKGDPKKGFLLGRDIPMAKFDCRTHLDKLIAEPTEAREAAISRSIGDTSVSASSQH
jgi:hypothetical protein